MSQSEYYVVEKYGLQAIFHVSGKQISRWFDRVYCDDLLNQKSKHFIAYKEKIGNLYYRYALFNISGKQVSRWFKKIVKHWGEKDSFEYYVAETGYGKELYHISGKKLAGRFDEIDPIVSKNLFIATKKGLKSIFDLKTGRQLSNWSNYIYYNNNSNYFIIERRQKKAIFDINLNRISNWFDDIYPEGLAKNESEYYVVRNNGKEAIFHISGKRISDWHRRIYLSSGILKGESDYYIVRQNEEKWAVVHVSRKVIKTFDDSELVQNADCISIPEKIKQLDTLREELSRLEVVMNKIEKNVTKLFKIKNHEKIFSICNNRKKR